MDELPGADFSQQDASAAEAMVQLSGYYGQQDESMDVDPNYDPSDFLGNLREQPREQKPQLDVNIAQYEQMSTYQAEDRKPAAAIHDDLAISDSDEDTGDLMTVKREKQEEPMGISQPPPVEAAQPDLAAVADNKDPNDDDLLWF